MIHVHFTYCRAKITKILEEKCLVRFDSKSANNDVSEQIAFKHILPLENCENGESDDGKLNCQTHITNEANVFKSSYNLRFSLQLWKRVKMKRTCLKRHRRGKK